MILLEPQGRDSIALLLSGFPAGSAPWVLLQR